MLLPEVSGYLTGSLPHNEMVRLLSRTRGHSHPDATRLIGESNQRLSFVLPALAEAFPDARYLWVIRDGRRAVASMHCRYWYHRREARLRHPALEPWAAHRIHADIVNDMTSERWRSLDPFARCCWYWAYTNRLIADQAATLGLNLLRVSLEGFTTTLPSVLDFLDLSDLAPADVPHANKTHSGPSARWWRSPIPWSDWTVGRRRTFDEFAGPVMDRYYAGWRDDADSVSRHPAAVILSHAARRACIAASACSRPFRPALSSAA